MPRSNRRPPVLTVFVAPPSKEALENVRALGQIYLSHIRWSDGVLLNDYELSRIVHALLASRVSVAVDGSRNRDGPDLSLWSKVARAAEARLNWVRFDVLLEFQQPELPLVTMLTD